jgi:tRNA(Ile2) C34 agmatinyltransferase TiaS
MKTHCPACEEPMVSDGRAFRCEACREIIIFFEVAETSPYMPAASQHPAQGREHTASKKAPA